MCIDHTVLKSRLLLSVVLQLAVSFTRLLNMQITGLYPACSESETPWLEPAICVLKKPLGDASNFESLGATAE